MKRQTAIIAAAIFATGQAFGQGSLPQKQDQPPSTAPAAAVQTLEPTSRLSTNQIVLGQQPATKCGFIGFTAKQNLAFALMNDAGGTIGIRIVERNTAKILNSTLLTDSDDATANPTWITMHGYMPDGRLLICLVSRKGTGMGIGSKKIHLVTIDEQAATLKRTSLNYEDPASSTWSPEKSIHRGQVCVQAFAINGKIVVINNYYLALLDPITLKLSAHTKVPEGGANYLGGYLLQSGGIWRSLDQTKGFRCAFGKPAEAISGDEYKRLEATAIPWDPWARKEQGNRHSSKAVGGFIEVKPSRGGSLRVDTGVPQLAGDAFVYERNGMCLITCRDSTVPEVEFLVVTLPKL